MNNIKASTGSQKLLHNLTVGNISKHTLSPGVSTLSRCYLKTYYKELIPIDLPTGS